MDQRKHLEETMKLVPVGNFISYMQPPLEQSMKKFGWDSLGIESCKYDFGLV